MQRHLQNRRPEPDDRNIRERSLEIALGRIESVIVHHIQHYADACLMQGLHHLLELTDTHIRFIRVGSVRAVGHIVILRVIPPVVFVLASLDSSTEA